jgi:hypothetical protein
MRRADGLRTARSGLSVFGQAELVQRTAAPGRGRRERPRRAAPENGRAKTEQRPDYIITRPPSTASTCPVM